MRGTFLERPNRFIVLVETNEGIVRAHCPNPGRLREILLADRQLILESSDKPGRKTRWTLAAAIYHDSVIPLISSRSNDIAGSLIIPNIYQDYHAVAEKKLGNSRIDWYLEKDESSIWIEVKACTLVEHRRAMFPDSPSKRAVKHLGELRKVPSGNHSEVIFTVMNPKADIFSANPHTDPDFCLALEEAHKSGVHIRAISLKSDDKGFTEIDNPELTVDLTPAAMVRKDHGADLRVWRRPGETTKWRMSVELADKNFSRLLRSKCHPENIPPDFILQNRLPIRGSQYALQNLKEEINACYNPEVNPLDSAEFLNIILAYRHRKVFDPSE